MKRLLCFVIGVVLTACQPQVIKTKVTILDGDKMISLQSESSTPADFIAQAGLPLSPADRILFKGGDLPLDFGLPKGGTYTIQIRRAHTLTLQTPTGLKVIRSTAATVGQALTQTGQQVYLADSFSPPAATPINSDLTLVYNPARDYSVSVDGVTIGIKSAAPTVGQALATAGISLMGLDKSQPPDDSPLPDSAQIKVIRVTENVTLSERSIPFGKKIEYSPDIPAGEQKVLQVGQPGLAVGRVRVRYEDGVEVSRVTETETIVRQPQPSIISLGSQVQVQSLEIPGGQIQYWRAVQMYATSYSPCRSGTSKCSYGTASGIPVRQGVVAVIPSLFNQLAGTQVYIPGYGLAVIGDVGGGFPDGRLWIDLGYSDGDYQEWSSMVTVYFLAPAPASIPPGLQ
jgi:uncharacterized protein YabE (DUF348 family)